MGSRSGMYVGTKRSVLTPSAQLRLCEVSGVITLSLQSCSIERAVDLGYNTCRATG